jgi:hypothetical protein
MFGPWKGSTATPIEACGAGTPARVSRPPAITLQRPRGFPLRSLFEFSQPSALKLVTSHLTFSEFEITFPSSSTFKVHLAYAAGMVVLAARFWTLKRSLSTKHFTAVARPLSVTAAPN